MESVGVFVPKDISDGERKDCNCQEFFEVIREDFINYFALGNVVGKHVVPTYEDKMLVRNFNFNLFGRHYGEFLGRMDYVKDDEVGDYVCGTCRHNYIVASSYKMVSMFKAMKSCYKKVV